MKLGVLFSGGKDSSLAAFVAKNEGYELTCLISISSKNQDSFMFHTPSIDKVSKQAEVMGMPLILRETLGERELELEDLRVAIEEARDKFGIEGIVTGAVESVYQASRVERVCGDLGLDVFNPLWQKDQVEILRDLVREKFKVIVVGVAAYPLDEEFLGREIDERFIDEIIKLQKKFEINPAGEGGEFESFVLGCPLFSQELKVVSFEDFGDKNSWRRDLVLCGHGLVGPEVEND